MRRKQQTVTRKELGKRLRELRLKSGLSGPSIAYLGIASSTQIYRMENGETYPALDTFIALMKLYKVDLPTILREGSNDTT